jgi:hypothetical protein
MSNRIAFERGLRLIGFAALAVALVLATRGSTDASVLRVIQSTDLPGVLSELSPPGDTILVVTDTALDPVYRDWLAAERVAGRGVRWGGGPVPATAVSVEPVADPAGGSRVLVAAPEGAVVSVSDSLGALDSVTARRGGGQVTVPRLVGGAAGTAGRQTAIGQRTDSLAARRILVFGAPSWETKFVIAVLEERGWQVDARVPLSPDAAVVQGSSTRLDTSRVAAVVALDRSAAGQSGRIEAFVRSGGGLVLGPDAAADARFSRVRAGSAGTRLPAPVLEVGAREPRRALALVPVVRLADGAVPLERRDGAVAVAARRVGAGRVAQLGYEDTWRWRMAGPDGSVEAHRLWWSAVVASVSYRPAVRIPGPDSPHDAPLARMVARLGPGESLPGGPSAEGSGDPNSRPEWWILAIGLAALVSEWASRRLRGAA